MTGQEDTTPNTSPEPPQGAGPHYFQGRFDVSGQPDIQPFIYYQQRLDPKLDDPAYWSAFITEPSSIAELPMTLGILFTDHTLRWSKQTTSHYGLAVAQGNLTISARFELNWDWPGGDEDQAYQYATVVAPLDRPEAGQELADFLDRNMTKRDMPLEVVLHYIDGDGIDRYPILF